MIKPLDTTFPSHIKLVVSPTLDLKMQRLRDALCCPHRESKPQVHLPQPRSLFDEKRSSTTTSRILLHSSTPPASRTTDHGLLPISILRSNGVSMIICPYGSHYTTIHYGTGGVVLTTRAHVFLCVMFNVHTSVPIHVSSLMVMIIYMII